MIKYLHILFISIGVTVNLFAQETNLPTQFSQDGILYKNVKSTHVLTEFIGNDKCTVIGYFGNDTYKVNYKNFEGFVDAEYLILTEEISDLIYTYQDNERNKTIEAEHKRKAEVQEIINENEEAKRQIVLKELAKKEEALRIEKQKQDAIAEIKVKESKKIEAKHVEKEQKTEVVKSIPKNENLTVCDYALNEFDPIDNIKIVRTNPVMLSENLSVELFRRGKTNHVFFNLNESLGCASYLPGNRSVVKVLLENNQSITLYHSWDMDCSDFSFKGNITNSQIKQLKLSPVKSVLLKGTKHSKSVTSIINNTFFIEVLRCLE